MLKIIIISLWLIVAIGAIILFLKDYFSMKEEKRDALKEELSKNFKISFILAIIFFTWTFCFVCWGLYLQLI